ncbi:UbiH/UbiF/VisC/COQ6 family ubiquinone biosynthesis hydroxylase [Halovulum dunhuangense]|uniref:UbiH/UbiF/VisC/COQ6 family ubiquinone biosynthesis hydroxylase n=1 Tax=Halovulum dunhuangense TaxID=1505036 RepID=A0A849KUC3_9RHOB|nr:UbiH/UbiF/VisC/COQ6 family ubiquinone biosynthesis hydroxylase [Halovulum dunhuangense]NNU78878.1 UbiH/UbiF/VisC/COQ6 family ubiquinone biosynthesis hydroxylase [Halovulum dunhuangense]
MGERSDILIVGGGLNGPALALAVAGAGLSAHVLDAAPAATLAAPDFDGRAYALALSTRRMLGALGIWDHVSAQAQPIEDIRVSDGRAGEGASPFHLHFDHREIAEGPVGHILEDRYLRAALNEAVAQTQGVTIEHGAEVVAQEVIPGGARVTLADGTTREGRLLVAADGRGSRTVQRAGISRTGWAYGQTSLVAALETELPHNATAHQMFFPEGPLAVLPLTGDRVSIVWTDSTTRADILSGQDEATYLSVLRPRFGSFLGEIRLIGRRYSYPLGLSLANRLVADRLALVGDAAHGIHPLAGQGLNLGLRDVAALAQVLAEACRRGEDIGAIDVLERYRAWRQFDIAMLATATDTINRAFSNANPLLRLGRTLALGAIDAMPGPRRRLMREAAGLTGDLPLLLQGRAI